jgi:hypothetical protein
LIGKPERKRPLGHRWEDSIEMGMRQTGWGNTVLVDLAYNGDQYVAFVNTVMDRSVPWKFGNSCVAE